MAFTIFGKKKEKTLSDVQKEINSEINQTKEELEDHLEAINENTGEIQSNYNHLCEVEAKIDKLNQRIDETQLLLKNLSKSKEFVVDNPNFSHPLTVPEREIFLVLYTSESNTLSYREIAERLSFTESIVKQLVSNLIERGIPIIKEYKHGKAFIKLDKAFKELQTKENVLKIDQTTLQKFQFVD